MPQTTDYDVIAGRYADGIDQRPWNALYERPATLALLPEVSGRDVLDAGCGNGWYAAWLVDHGARVTGVDRSAAMVKCARERLENNVQLLVGNIEDLHGVLESESFDVVLSALVLHYAANLAAVFSEFARVLRPHGVLVFSTHHPFVPDRAHTPGYLKTELVAERWDWLNETMRFYCRPLREITEPLADAGFVIERLVEPMPGEDLARTNPQLFDQLSRLPAFLSIRARKAAC